MTETPTLPTTNDIDALKQLTYALALPMLERGSGVTRELFSNNAPRILRVWWDANSLGNEGWAYATRRRNAAHDSGGIDTVAELRALLEWVEGERAALAGEVG